jgi:hypothetical protein
MRLNWTSEGSVGGVFSNKSGYPSTQGRIPYLIERRHDGVSLSVNLLVRGIKTPERAREIAQAIEDTVDALIIAGGVR